MIEIPSSSFIEKFKSTQGAFSVCESIALFNIVKEAPSGEYLELGSHKGKSGMSAALGLKEGTFHLVEPIFEDTELTSQVVKTVKEFADKNLAIVTYPYYSTDIIPLFNNLSFVFIDSGIHDDLVMVEVKMLEDRVIQGGIIAVHDYKNQFTAVERAYNYLLSTGKYEKIEIDWPAIFSYVRENNLEEGNVSWHERGSEEFPKFVGALKKI